MEGRVGSADGVRERSPPDPERITVDSIPRHRPSPVLRLRRALIGLSAAAAALSGPSIAAACSQDNATYFESFLDTTCLVSALTNTTLDALGGLRLATNGAPSALAWDTDTEFTTGVTHDTVAFGRVGVSTLALSGTGAPATLGLPTTTLPLTPDGNSPVLSPTASTVLDGDHVDGPSVIKVGAQYVMYYGGLAEDGTGPRIFRATSSDGKSWTRAVTPNNTPVLVGTPGAFDQKGVFGPHVIYDPADAAAPYRMYYSGRGAVFGGIGYATSTDGIAWVKHTGTASPADPPAPVLDHGEGGSADSFRAADPWVIKDGAVWKMWYTGDDSNLKRVAYATSVDGKSWQKGGSVLAPDGAGGNFGSGIYAPTVWKDGPTYEMLFVGLNTATKIISASSPDGIDWTTGNVSLNTQNGSFHASNFDSPAVFDEGVAGPERYKLYYAGSSLDTSGNFHVRVGLSITASGSGWQGGKFSGSQAGGAVLDIGTLGAEFDARGASGISVALTGGTGGDKYVGFYSGARGSDFTPRLGEARAADGATWAKIAGAATGGALFATGNAASPDHMGQLEPAALLDAGAYNLYYAGLDSGSVASIVRTTSLQDATSKLPTNVWTARAQVLAGDGTGFDADRVSHPSVILDGAGNYLMYYTGGSSGASGIGRAQSGSPAFTAPTRTQVLSAGVAGTIDEGGVKDPVVAKVAAGDYRMTYTAVDAAGVQRLAYATSADGATWTKQSVVLSPSQSGFAYDERGVRASGMVVDGTTLHVYTGGLDQTGRERSGHATHAIGDPASGIPSGWATYQVGNTTTAIRDWQAITRTSSASGVELWLSFLQPYSGTGSFGDLWSDYFPVTSASGVPEDLNLLLTVRGLRWQARLSGPSGAPTLDKVAIDHASVQFHVAGSARTLNVEPAATLALTGWGTLTVNTETFAPGGGGNVGGTVSVRNADTDAELIPLVTLNTTGTTTQSLTGINPAQNRRLRLVLNLASDGTATPKVRSTSVSYTAVMVTSPIAFLSAIPTAGPAPLAVALDASSSLAPSGRTITAYNWDFDGNGTVDQTTATPTASFTYLGGTYTAKLTITDSTGAVSTPATVTITATDATAPLNVALTAPASLSKPFQVLKTLPLTWTATDAESVITGYALRYREAPIGGVFGPQVALPTTVSTGMVFTPKPGSTYCFRVRATNNVGLSAESAERCTAKPLHSYALTAKGTWAKKSRTGHYLNRYRTAKVKGATLLRSGVTVKRLAIVATRGKGMGSVTVYLGTTKLKTINLAATTTRKRQVISIANFTKVRKGTVKIVVTTSGKPVIIEGLAISKV